MDVDEKVYEVSSEEEGKRIDKYLSKLNKDLSRSYIQKLIDNDKVLVNGESVKRSFKVNRGDHIRLIIPPPEDSGIKPVEMDLDIIYEDKDILVLNKNAGLVVHPAPGNHENTLVNALIAYCDNLSTISGVNRPGIVHRLDKDTSGVMVIAKNDISHRKLVEQFKQRKTKKYYRTLLKGELPYKEGKIDAPIGRDPHDRKKMAVTRKNSKKAVTYFKVLEFFRDHSYVEVELKTGRTHQIRVHFSYMGFPVVGDSIYGKKRNRLQATRQLLHAYRLGFYHPRNDKWVEYKASLPDDFKKALDILENKFK
ncbi:RluA family pseudouridine synthase [Halothermothrix orenii]|uniref:Pseudouridine synthase n=1 Tax=Halothermothrix orenii (strain H 168 / OCM 544 / DSM 9562) TaxID=373903 RepID=B8CWM0_HALOH|nr:RluA family pseudouridine synthase [Halothermothrix orenii]ACL69689.1 ribosomal large subunit pseudouridine synthase D [Halothermothrix orenii H 168]